MKPQTTSKEKWVWVVRERKRTSIFLTFRPAKAAMALLASDSSCLWYASFPSFLSPYHCWIIAFDGEAMRLFVLYCSYISIL